MQGVRSRLDRVNKCIVWISPVYITLVIILFEKYSISNVERVFLFTSAYLLHRMSVGFLIKGRVYIRNSGLLKGIVSLCIIVSSLTVLGE